MTVWWMLHGLTAGVPAVSSLPTQGVFARRAASTSTIGIRVAMENPSSRRWNTRCAMRVGGIMEVSPVVARPNSSQAMSLPWVPPWVLGVLEVLVCPCGLRPVVEGVLSFWWLITAASNTASLSSHQSIDKWRKKWEFKCWHFILNILFPWGHKLNFGGRNKQFDFTSGRMAEFLKDALWVLDLDESLQQIESHIWRDCVRHHGLYSLQGPKAWLDSMARWAQGGLGF